MIEVENLSKRYGEKLAADGLDFVVQPGIVTGFLGPNGAGKSTTMRMIAGLDEPTAGRVRVNGRDYRAATAPMAELGILGFVDTLGLRSRYPPGLLGTIPAPAAIIATRQLITAYFG
jgi:ABC-type multidrug transport system ATPase subunit